MKNSNQIGTVEVSVRHRTARIVAAVVLVVIGALAIANGLIALFNTGNGWQSVEVSTNEANCAKEFQLRYYFESGDKALQRQVKAIYTEACVKAYQLFQVDVGSEDYENVYDINHNVNTPMTVDPLLYQAFEKLEGTRYLYLGSLYAYYNNMIFNTTQNYLPQIDPVVNEEAKAYVERLAHWGTDPQAVTLELLGENRIQLTVSPEYQAFARENEIENFIDFRYMTNAFIVDYIAGQLQQQGYTRCVISSVDGYTRNLDTNTTYEYNIFQCVENTVSPVGVMQYQGPVSMVFLKDYPLSSGDMYYGVSGDHRVHTYVDGEDGMYRTSISELVGYSYEDSCVDVLLAMLPSFIGEEFSVPQGIYSVWCQEQSILYNDETIAFTNLFNDGMSVYTAKYQK